MIWQEAFEEAQTEFGFGYCDYKKIVDRAKEILSEEASIIAREKHLEYLKSDEWKLLKLKILKRDNYLCQDCLLIYPEILKLFKNFNSDFIKYKRLATEVHHLDYNYKQTLLESAFCISLCRICHQIRHTQSTYGFQILSKKRYEEILKYYNFQIINHEPFIEFAQKIHNEFINFLTIKPSQLKQGDFYEFGI